MTEQTDYLAFRDTMIVAIANDQEPPGLGSVDLIGLCERMGITPPFSWVQTLPHDMQSLGWGRDTSTLKGLSFLISGGGLARAAEIRAARRPRNFFDWLKGFTRSDWIAFAAMLVSLFAIYKGK